MAGLNLTGSAGVFAGLPSSYASSDAGATISARAYGVGSETGGSGGDKLPALGGSLVGVLGVVTLLWLWWTLPR